MSSITYSFKKLMNMTKEEIEEKIVGHKAKSTNDENFGFVRSVELSSNPERLPVGIYIGNQYFDFRQDRYLEFLDND